MCGTPGYIAPEILTSRSLYGKEVDLWCMGIILYALITSEMPFKCGDIKTNH